MHSIEDHHLAIMAAGPKALAWMGRLSETISNCKCNITHCSITPVGQEYSMNLVASGNWGGHCKTRSGPAHF